MARIGRIEHLAGFGCPIWRFKAAARARFAERRIVRAQTRSGEPQSTGGEQRRDREEQTFSFHWFNFFVQVSGLLSLRHGAWISGSWRSIWNEGGKFWCEAPASRNEPGPNLIPIARFFLATER
jgi:hypothetical protein